MLSVGRILVLAAIAVGTWSGFEQARDGISAHGIRAHLYFLSHDRLDGRVTGTDGGDLAAEYIATQFIRMGVQPVNGSRFQDVPVRGVTTDPTSVSLAFELGDRRIPALYPREAVVWSGAAAPNVQVSGELVFVGYGISAAEWRWDDFKGRDLAGKILLFLVGEPPAPPEEPSLFDGRTPTHHGSWTYKLEEAQRRGAAGALLIHTAASAGHEWEVIERSWTGERLILDHRARGLPLMLEGWIAQDLARGVLDSAGMDLDELFVQAARRDFRPVATGVTVRARMVSRSRNVPARNVLGLVPGTHPDHGGEVVVMTAPYDRAGPGQPSTDGSPTGSGGAGDAGGVSLLLELAAAFARLDPGPERSILFLATTGEDAGLLGSTHFVARPPVPMARVVAAITMDAANLWGETDDVVVVGAAGSALSDLIRPRATELGLEISPDLDPPRAAAFRSDHFAFAHAGVPAAYLGHGLRFRGRPAGWGERVMDEARAGRSPQPPEDRGDGFNLDGALQQARLLFGIGYDLAHGSR